MGFRERVNIILDVDGKAGVAGFKSFGGSIREADGFMGKFRAGATSAMASVKANAGAFALAGGAALVAFAIKAVGAFEDTAKAALDLGSATGLGVEDASRWIGAADDMGVSASDLTTSLGMVTKSLDAAKWDKYGIATRDAGGNARDVNDILLDTFDVLAKETNLTERARLGKELLGKGYASLSPMIGKTREEMEKYLGSVEKGQVITAAEAEKAEKMRLAQDHLKDALGEVTLAFGSAVAGLAPLVTLLADVVTATEPVLEVVGTLADGINKIDWSDPIGGIDGYKMSAEGAAQSLDELNVKLAKSGLSAEEQAKVLKAWHDANDGTTESTNTLADAVDAVAEAGKAEAEAAKAATEAEAARMKQALTAASSMWTLEESQRATDKAYSDYIASLTDGKSTMSDYRDSQLNVAQSITDTTTKQVEAAGADLNTEAGVRTLIAALQAQQDKYPAMRDEIQRYIDKLNAIPTNVHTSITTAGYAGVGGSGRKYAHGTTSAASGVALVGEQGPELVMMGGGETVIPAGQTAAMLGGGGGGSTINLTINTTQPVDGAMIVRELRTYERRNGPGWRA